MNIWNLIHDNLFRVCNLHTAERDLLSLLFLLLSFWICSLSLSTSRNYWWIFREPSIYTSRLRHVQIVSWTWPHMVLKFQVWNVFGWSRYQQKEDGKNASMRCYCCKSFLILFRLIPCGDIYCRPHTYCRRRQFMPVHLAHIVAQKLFLPPATMYADIFKIWHKSLAIEYAVNIETNCRWKLYWISNKVPRYCQC